MIDFDQEISKRLGLSLNSASDVFRDDNNNSGINNKSVSHTAEKYSLRPRSIRRRNMLNDDLEENQSKNSKSTRKPALLSKYRRKTANARERSRMQEINQAFETLRMVVPHVSASQQENEKCTKITTLRLAMKYISTLSAVLSNTESVQQDLFSECFELDNFLLESDGESINLPSDLSDHSVTPAEFSNDFSDFSENTMEFTPLSPSLSQQLYQYDPFLTDFS